MLQDKIDYAKFILLLQAPFFGNLLYSIKIIEVDNGDTTIYTNGKHIYVNKKYGESLSKRLFATFILKNLLHIVFRHKKRMQPYHESKIRFSIGASYAVNNIIKSEVNKDDLFEYLDFEETHFVVNDKFHNKSAEQIFEELSSIKKDKELLKKDKNGKGGIDIPALLEKMNNEEELKPFQKELLNAMSLYLEVDDEDMTPEEDEELDSCILRAHFLSKNHGSTPLSIERLVNELKQPKIDWRHYLSDFIERSVINDYDFSERDRRMMYTNFILPSIKGEKLRIALAVDCSGSISEEDLKNFLTECYGIFQQYQSVELFLMSFDAEVANSQVIENEMDLMQFEFLGGGGTDFIPVFDKLEEEGMYDGLVIITDGYGSFPEVSNIKTIWVMTTDVEPPFGSICRYEADPR